VKSEKEEEGQSGSRRLGEKTCLGGNIRIFWLGQQQVFQCFRVSMKQASRPFDFAQGRLRTQRLLRLTEREDERRPHAKLAENAKVN